MLGRRALSRVKRPTTSISPMRRAAALGTAALRGVAAPGPRSVRAAVASTSVQAADGQQDMSYVVDRAWTSAAAELEQGAASGGFRQLEVNCAPATRFTVDDVAAADARRFELHPSVAFWGGYRTRFNSRSLTTVESDPEAVSRQRADDLARAVRELLDASTLGDAQSAAYWAYHLGRTAFFLGASASGALAHHLATQARAALSSGLPGAGGAPPPRTPFQNLAANARNELTNRLYEGVAMFKADLENIQAGQYKLPWDMVTPTHRQYNPLFALTKSAQFVAEAVSTLDRRVAQGPAANWLSSGLGYPPYYMASTFHYQSDGWFSSSSASIYEFSTEALFFGRQDAMQRAALLPLARHVRRAGGGDPSRLRLLEVCCGTGRFHTFVKDNWPTMPTVASDLSPFYLARARDNVRYWKQQRGQGLELGGPDGTGTTYLQCAAESVPLPPGSLDVVVCVYAFHEMPEEARLAAAREWLRLLRPGGLAVLADSVQLGDRPEWDATLGAFGNFNEPHYRNYIACDMGALFEEAGFTCESKYVASATKVLSFVKPGGDTSANGDAGANGDAVPAAPAAEPGAPELN